MDNKNLLDQVKIEMERLAGKLPLTKSSADIVPAEGNPEAEIILIGEAPGYYESVERKPFVGAAGKLLTTILLVNGIKREEVWISNILKTRPPGNRDPFPEEIEAFRPFLDREIEIIQPKIIVTLGRFSMYKFLGDQVRISQVHGQARWVNFKPNSGVLPLGSPVRRPPLRFSDRAGCGRSTGHPAKCHPADNLYDGVLKVVVLPMYHPAAGLRSSNVKKMFEEDFKKLPKILAKIKGENDKIEVAKVTRVAKVTQEKEEQLKLI